MSSGPSPIIMTNPQQGDVYIYSVAAGRAINTTLSGAGIASLSAVQTLAQSVNNLQTQVNNLDIPDTIGLVNEDDLNDLRTDLDTKIAQKLAISSNLSDLANPSTALSNLGATSFGKNLITSTDASQARGFLGVAQSGVLEGQSPTLITGGILSSSVIGTDIARLNSPVFTGNPTAPTQTAGNSSTSIATTQFVDNLVKSVVGAAPAELDTLKEISDRLSADATSYAALVTTISGKLAKDQNLADLTSVDTALTNLGFGLFGKLIVPLNDSATFFEYTGAASTISPNWFQGYQIITGTLTVSDAATFASSVKARTYTGGTLSTGTNSLDLNVTGTGFPCIDFLFPGGSSAASLGLLRVGQVSVRGSNDILFQGCPLTSAGWVYFEAWSPAAGLALGTGTSTAPVEIRPNRITTATFSSNGNLTLTGSFVSNSTISGTAFYQKIGTDTIHRFSVENGAISLGSGVATRDVGLIRSAAGTLKVSNGSSGTGNLIAGSLSVESNLTVTGTVTHPTPASTDNSTRSATTAWVKNQVGSTRITTSSAGIIQNSNVSTGGGTDQTTAIQALLDTAITNGRLHLIVDGAILISNTLLVSSNTIIECISDDCGFYQANGSNVPMFRNKNPTTNIYGNGFPLVYPAGYTWANRASYAPTGATRPAGSWTLFGTDKNIRFVGGTYNGNWANQTHDKLGVNNVPEWVTPFAFHGISNLRFDRVRLWGMRTYGWYLTNWCDVYFTDCIIDSLRTSDFNGDGIHFNGPGTRAFITNLSARGSDDVIAISPNDLGIQGDGSPSNYGPYGGPGDITDVHVDGVCVHDGRQGIRCFTSTNLLDRVTLKGIKGYTRNVMIIVDCYSGSDEETGEKWTQMLPNGKGNIGSLTIEDVDALIYQEDTYHATVIDIGCIAQNIILRNIRHRAFTFNRPVIKFNFASNVQNAVIDGLTSYDTLDKTTEQVLVEGKVRSLILSNSSVRRNSSFTPTESPLLRINRGYIDSLSISNIIVDNSTAAIDYQSGTLNRINITGMTHTVAGNGSSILIEGGRVLDFYVAGALTANLYAISNLGSVKTFRGEALSYTPIKQVLALSTFNGHNDSTNPPLSDIGPAWEVTAGSFYVYNRAAGTDTNSAMVVNVSTSNVTISAIASLVNTGGFIQFRVRQIDENNYIGLNYGGETMQIYSVVGGAASLLSSIPATANANVPQSYIITANGTSISFSWGSNTVTATTSTHQTATRFGWRASNGSSLDMFRVEAV